MIHVSEPFGTAPTACGTPLQEKAYGALLKLNIPFQRVETDEVVTMEDCAAVNRKLDMKMVKTLFLCNRQQTQFYLLVIAGDKPFKAGEFAGRLGVPRLSFAPAERMEAMLGTRIGAATVFSALLDSAKEVRFAVDEEVAAQEWYGCSDGTTTGYLKIRTAHVLGDLLPFAGHRPLLVRA